MTEGKSRVLRKICVFFVIPLGVTGTLIAMYFSGNETLQQIVSPRLPGMNPNTGRELGLLENLQNVVLLAMLAIAIVGFRRKERRIEKAALGFVAAFTLFVLLEEVDYGLHIYEYVNDVKWVDSAKTRNLHNVGDRTDVAKTVVDVGMILFFFIVPLIFAKSRHALIRYLTPDRYSILTLIAAFIARTVAHELKDQGFGTGGTINKNLSEFRELITYYLFMLYLVEIVLRRTWEKATAPAPEATEQAPEG